MIKTFRDDSFRDVNAYLVYNESNKAILIDTANNAYHKILSFTENNNIEITDIFITHGHFSHFYGINEIVNKHKPNNVYVHQEDLLMLFDPNKNTSFYYNVSETGWVPEPFKQLKVIRQDMTMTINGFELEIKKFSGHTPGSILIIIEQEEIIFSGDAIFLDKTPMFVSTEKFDKELFLKNIENLSKKINPKFKLYPGHFEYGYEFKEILEKKLKKK